MMKKKRAVTFLCHEVRSAPWSAFPAHPDILWLQSLRQFLGPGPGLPPTLGLPTGEVKVRVCAKEQRGCGC